MKDSQETVLLVNAAQGGDRAALDQLVVRYLPWIRASVALRARVPVRRLTELEDLVQDTVLSVLESMSQYENRSEGSFRNWLATIAHSRIHHHLRQFHAVKRGGGRTRRFADLGTSVFSESVFPGHTDTPSKVAHGREFEERLEEALLSLPDRYRRVIELRRICEMSYEETAAEMGIKVSSARGLFSRALARLSAAL